MPPPPDLAAATDPADAAHALERVAERNEDWDNDPRFNDDLDAPPNQRDDDADGFVIFPGP